MTGKRWRLSFWPVFALALTLPALVGLGLWQLERGAQKAELHARFDSGQHRSAFDAAGLSLQEFNAIERYRNVDVPGRYLGEHQVLLDHMPREGVPGHHVLVPFQPDGANYLIMVDRGWRPGIATDANDELPIASQPLRITGLLAEFPRPALLLEGADVPAGWPKPMQFPQPAQFAAVLEADVAEHRLLLAANEPDGFVRDWSAPGMPPARHYAYAFQWFALALALSVIAVALAWPRERGDDP